MVPISPTLTVGALFSFPGLVHAMAAKGNLLYVCLAPSNPDSSTALFYVVDATDISNPKITGTTLDYGTYGYIYGLALFGTYAYVDTYYQGLVVLDISNPSAPRVLATYDTLASIPVGISGSHLYAVGYGLDYLSLTDPVHPKREGRAGYDFQSNRAVPWDETRLSGYDLGNHDIVLVDFSNPQVPKTLAVLPLDNLKALAYCNGRLFLSPYWGSPAMTGFTWDGGHSLKVGGQTALPGEIISLATLGDRLAVGVVPNVYPQNLFLLSTTGLQAPYVVGECELPRGPFQLAADGTRIYAYLGNGELVAVEVTEH